MTPKANRFQTIVRLVLLAAIAVASSACYFDGHFGHFGSCHGARLHAPVRHCR
jgi:hypothetical protein